MAGTAFSQADTLAWGQRAMAAMLKGATDGTFNFVADIKEYGEKAKIMKQLFTVKQNTFAWHWCNATSSPT